MSNTSITHLMESIIPVLADVVANGFMLSLLVVGGTFFLIALLEKVRPVNAATRYALWGMSLALIVVSHAGLAVRHVDMRTEAPSMVQRIEASQATPEFSSTQSASVLNESESNGSTSEKAVSPIAHQTSVDIVSKPTQLVSIESGEINVAEVGGVTVRGAMSWVLTGVLALIVAGMVAGMGRLVYGMLFVVRLHRKARILEGESERHDWMADLHRSVQVGESDLVASPVAVGLFGSMVVVPVGLKERVSQDAWEQMLLHETAHLERFDDWTLFFQRFVECLFFYNPIVKWVGNRLSDEREAACDDWVVARTRNPVHYVASIGEVMQARIVAMRGSLTPGLADQPGSLLRRMRRVLENGIPVKAVMSKEQVAVLSAIVILLVALVFVTSPFMTWDIELEHVEPVEAVQVVDVLPEPAPLAPEAPLPREPELPDTPLIPDTPEVQDAIEPVDATAPVMAPRVEQYTAMESSVDPLSEASWLRMLSAASKVNSDGDKASVLRFSIGRFPMTSRTLEVWLRAASSVSGSGEKASLLKALVREGQVPDEFMPDVIQVAATIRTNGDKASAISSIMREASDTEAIRNALEKAIGSVSSSGEQSRLMAQFAREFRS